MKNKYISKVRLFSSCVGCILYISLLSKAFIYILSLVSATAFFYCLSAAKPTPRYFSIGMFILGVGLNFYKGNGFERTVEGIVTNLPILTLVILVPLLSIPLKISGYFESVQYFIVRMLGDLRKIFGSLSLFVACLGPILNLGSIRVLHETVKGLKISSVVLAKSYLVGFSTVILWSPYFASVALVLFYLDVPVSSYIPIGLTLAVIQFIIGNVLFSIWMKRNKVKDYSFPDSVTEAPANERHHRKNIKLLLGILIVLMSSVFMLEILLRWPMMFLVSLVSVLYPIIWCTFSRKWQEAKNYFIEFKNESAPSMNNEVVLFISAGLFGKALQGTVIAKGIKSFLLLVSQTSFLLFVLTIIFIVVVFTFIGVHQIVVVTALVTQIDPALIGTTPEVIALLFMVSWSLGAVVSPVNPLNLLVSGSVKESGISVGLRWNGYYLLCMFFVGVLYIYMIH